MSYTTKPFEKLDLLDDFLMNAIACDEQVGIPCCRKLLSVLLQKEIGKIRITAQKVFPGLIPDLRGIRMDVEIEEYSNKNDSVLSVYDLEPHLQKDLHFPKHNRFYQAKIDSRYIRSGENDFSKMPNLYVITITNFDLFGKDNMVYTFRNKCVEVPDLPYEDGLQFIYFNTTGKKGGSKEIADLLHYMEMSIADNAVDATTAEIHRYVQQIKTAPEVRNGYMRFDDIIAMERKELLRDSIFDLLSDYGEIPESLKNRILDTYDIATLKRWLKLASVVTNTEDFIHLMDKTEIIIEKYGHITHENIMATERAETRQDDLFDLLSDYGEIPEALKDRILDTYDIATLKRWLKLAARAGSIEEFTRQMD